MILFISFVPTYLTATPEQDKGDRSLGNNFLNLDYTCSKVDEFMI